MRYGRLLNCVWPIALMGACLDACPVQAADKARITGLTDINFGTIAGTGDQSVSQSLCAFANSNLGGYSVVALGSGGGGAFELSSASAALSYEVLWADAAGQTGGSQLVPGVASTGFVSDARHQACNTGPSASASLTIVIRGVELDAASSGSYTGTLLLTIAPE